VFVEVFLDMVDVEFAMTTTPAVLEEYKVKAGSVVLFKKVQSMYSYTEKKLHKVTHLLGS